MENKLQNNFTTPEQSKRLLELGVPADSADCYRQLNFEHLPWIRNTKSELDSDMWDELINGKSINIPCWSAGRLIEIFELCYTDKLEEHIWYNHQGKGDTIVERVMWDFNNKAERLDFSKLEELV